MASFVSLALVCCLSAASLPDAYELQGRVTAPDATPLDSVHVEVRDGASGSVLAAGVYTDADGRYTVTFSATPTAVDPPTGAPALAVHAAYPNPASDRVTITYTAPPGTSETPALELFDVLGRRYDPAGPVAAGTYFYRLRLPDGTVSASRSLTLERGPLWIVLTPAAGAARLGASKRTAADERSVVVVATRPGYERRSSVQLVRAGTPGTVDFVLPTIALTPARRTAAIDTVSAQLDGITGATYEEREAAVLDVLRRQVEFVRHGVSADGTVWAEFADGALFFIIQGSPHDPPAAPGARPHGVRRAGAPRAAAGALHLPAAGLPAAPPMHRAGAAAGSFLPTSNTFRLLNGVGSYFDDTDPRPQIRAMLEAGGYHDAGSGPATLPALRAVQGDGVFYFRTHGGWKDTTFALWTATPVDPEAERTDPQLAEDVRQRRVVYLRFANTWFQRHVPIIRIEPDEHYGITGEFVRHYMTFAPGSFVYIDACQSGAMWGAFKAQKASVYAGWDERAMFGVLGETSQYVFDRLLGANTFDPEDPPQRPFDTPSLRSDPKFGQNERYGWSHYVGDGTRPPIDATLWFMTLNPGFRLLAPSIKNLDVDEVQQTLTLHGLFGAEPPPPDRRVLIGGADATIDTWDSVKVVVQLEPQHAGLVSVEVRGHPSNQVPLTRLTGQIRYTYDTPDGGPNDIAVVTTCDVTLRGDFHPYREAPGAAPVERKLTLTATRAASCSWSLTGHVTDTCGETPRQISLSDSGAIPWLAPAQKPFSYLPLPNDTMACGTAPWFLYEVAYTPADRALTTKALALLACAEIETVDCEGRKGTLALPVWWDGAFSAFAAFPLPKLGLDAAWNVAPVKPWSPAPLGGAYKLEWINVRTEHPPTDDTES